MAAKLIFRPFCLRRPLPGIPLTISSVRSIITVIHKIVIRKTVKRKTIKSIMKVWKECEL